jgi:hypothetical protein
MVATGFMRFRSDLVANHQTETFVTGKKLAEFY